jgi:hypothetical protein
MPLALVIELVVSAFFSTNNVYRFHFEMMNLYKPIEKNGLEILMDGKTLGEYGREQFIFKHAMEV